MIINFDAESGEISLQKTFVALSGHLMLKKGYNDLKLAKETKTSPATISEYRQGKRAITTRTFELLINHLLKQPDIDA